MSDPNVATALWRRVDVPGHDACRLAPDGDGWRLEGTAVFAHPDGPAWVTYSVACDAGWRTREGTLRGRVGARAVDAVIRHDAAGWTVNGAPAAGLEGCLDLDLGFTPATNALQLRRAGLRVGEAADVPVAWCDVPDPALERLAQRYDRRDAGTYWYESPSAGYAGRLAVDGDGFAAVYPGLWERVRTG